MKERSNFVYAAAWTLVSSAVFCAQSPLIQNASDLAQFPSIEKIRAAEKGTDDVDTHARFIAALWRINDMIKEDLRKAPNGGYYDMPPAAQTVQYRYSGAITQYTMYQVPPAGRDPRFRPLEEKYEKDPMFFDGLLTQFFSPEFRIDYYDWVGKPVPQQTTGSASATPFNAQTDSSTLASSADAIAFARALAGPQLWADEARKLRAAGNEAAALAKFDSAVRKLKEIIATYPSSRYPGVKSAYVLMGKIYMTDLRQYDLALPVFQELRKLQPTDPVNAVLIGQALYQLKRNDEALQAFREALAMKPAQDMTVITHLAMNYIYRDKALYDKALIECQEALRFDPNSSSAYHSLGINYYHLKDHPKAIDSFQQAIRLKYTPV
jgi:tetratricopeptide (TPR) repeat protein